VRRRCNAIDSSKFAAWQGPVRLQAFPVPIHQAGFTSGLLPNQMPVFESRARFLCCNNNINML
jgi:hypothetical protein